MLKRILAIAACLCILLCASKANAQVPPGTLHSATISWTAPNPVGGSGTVSGYNVYRCGGAGCTNFVKLNTAVVAAANYTDSAVGQSNIYVYSITTVDSAGTESAGSTPLAATIPANPNAPTTIIIVTH